MGDCGDFTQNLIGKGIQHPPCHLLFLFKQRKQLFTIQGQADILLVLLFRPYLYLIIRYFPSVTVQAEAMAGLTPYPDIPVF